MTERFTGYVSLEAYCADICIGAKNRQEHAECERECLHIEAEAWSRSHVPEGQWWTAAESVLREVLSICGPKIVANGGITIQHEAEPACYTEQLMLRGFTIVPVDRVPYGYVLVERDRLERLTEAGREYRAMLASQCGAYVGVTRNCTPVVTEDDVRYEWEAGG